jgi:hypothetical protein
MFVQNKMALLVHQPVRIRVKFGIQLYDVDTVHQRVVVKLDAVSVSLLAATIENGVYI